MAERATGHGATGVTGLPEASDWRGVAANQRRIARVEPGQLVNLSGPQHHLWLSAQMFPESAEDSIVEVRRFERLPARERIEGAVRVLIARHDAMRVRVIEIEGVPRQEDLGSVDPPVEWVDLTDLDPELAEVRARQIAADAAETPLRPSAAPLFRIIGIVLPGGSGWLVLGFHHLVFDHWSLMMVMSELGTLLSGGELGPPPDVSFLEYVSWVTSSENERGQKVDLAYWLDKLNGDLSPLQLPWDRPRANVPTRDGDQIDIDLGPSAPLVDFVHQEFTTAFIVLLTAYKVFLHRVTGQTDIIVGSPLAGRDDVVTEEIVGCFLKPVALRTELSGALSFRDALRQVEAVVLEAMDHQQVPFHRVVAELNLQRTPGVSPVFQTVFGAQSQAELRVDADDIASEYLPTKSAKVDLSPLLTVTSESIVASVEYATDLFDEATVRRLLGMYTNVLHAGMADPDALITSLPLMDAEEEQRVLHHLHVHRQPEARYESVAEPFEEWATRTPDAVAAVAGDESMTYRELDVEANRFANHLLRAGAVPGCRVALILERGLPMLVAAMAVAKMGCSYVPIDTDAPDERLRFMLEDSAPSLVVTDGASSPRVQGLAVPVIDIADRAQWESEANERPEVKRYRSAALYLLYTSGTTGRPKAVSYPTDGLLANIAWLQRRYPFAPAEASLFKTSYGFDVSAWEIFWPLASGARVVVAQPGGQRDPAYLSELIDRHGVTMAFFVPSMLPSFIEAGRLSGCPTLRWLFCGGEAVSPRLRDMSHDAFVATLINCCGPTEAGSVVDMALARTPSDPRVPLGEPADNFRVYILDDRLKPVPVGLPGEMFVGAEVGLAHGYFGRAGLTAERFVPDPFGPPGSRMYRTGDSCRHTDGGVIEHLGRIGRQLKIRGLRVEPDEIESVLEEHPGVGQAAVMLLESGQLGACVVPVDTTSRLPSGLEDHLCSKLPAHMIPTRMVAVEVLPVNLNDKLDHRAVEQRFAEELATEVRQPTGEAESPTEAVLLGIFSDLLQLPAVCRTDSFFEIGGHSILVFRLASRCEELLGVKPSVADIFNNPSVRELASLLDRGAENERAVVPLAGEGGRPQLLFVHAASGAALPFVPVAQLLADRFDVYGLQTPAGDCETLSIIQLAERHAAAVDDEGLQPVAVVGWSMGGCIAIEMARRWRSVGRSTAVLLLDTWLPPKLMAAESRDAVLQALGGVDVGITADEYAQLHSDREGLERTFARNRDAFLDYRPDACGFPAVLLAATEPYPSPVVTFPPSYLEGDRGFTGLLTAIERREIAGDHHSAVSPGHAESLALTIASSIEHAGR